MKISKLLLTASFLFTMGPLSGAAHAATDYPNRQVRAVVPFVPGGPADHMMRFLADGLSKKWGQTVVVENKGGAGGMIGGADIVKAQPDGYTFGFLVTGHFIQPSIQSKMPYDVLKDFAPITVINRAPKLILARAEFPASNLPELIALTKESPERYGAYGTSGVGSMANLSMEQINQLAGAQFVHVPYKGGGAIVSDLLGGTLPLAVLDLASVQPHVESGKLKVISVAGITRSPVFPDVPTAAELIPGFEATEWFGLAAPAPSCKTERRTRRHRDIGSTFAGTPLVEDFLPGHDGGLIGKLVIGRFLIDENLQVELPVAALIEQSDGNRVEVALFQAIEQMTAALQAEPALRPVRRRIDADMLHPLDIGDVMLLHAHQRATAPAAADVAMAYAHGRLLRFDRQRDRPAQAASLNAVNRCIVIHDDLLSGVTPLCIHSCVHVHVIKKTPEAIDRRRCYPGL